MAKKTAHGVMDPPQISRQEWKEATVEWNETAAEYPEYRGDRCVHELFEQQAERTPDAVALVQEGKSLTYDELNRRANQLAHYLREMGVGAEVKVGLCLERSLEMIVGLLGVMKAGGAYLPLDPDYPQERLAYMIEDGQCPVTITIETLVEKLRGIKTEVVSLDADWERIARRSEEKPNVSMTSENLAYVIFTSGSTGKPKGVAIEHRQIMNYIAAIIERLGMSANARFAMVQPLTFDSCATVIYPALSTGGCLHVLAKEQVIDPQALSEYFSDHEIDCLKITPSHLAALQIGIDAEKVLPRERLVIGGESSSTEWVERLREMRPECKIMIHYGPTETTVGMLTYDVEEDRTDSYTTVVPVGHTLENTQAYVLDRLMEPVPVGVGGELYIGGLCIARGYLNHPEITAERFIPDMYGRERGGRVYKTGDQARYLRDGNIEFLGRLDQQVKIRGYRIELGEIEAAFNQHASVEQAVVLAREDEPGERRLVGYLVVDPEYLEQTLSKQEWQKERIGQWPTDEAELKNKRQDTNHPPQGRYWRELILELRSYLENILPGYMVPSAFVALESLPLMPNGKINRAALPKPELSRASSQYVEPRTAVEKIVCGIWAEVLRVEKVGTSDRFFELGGHSLLATQVVARVRNTLGVEVPLQSLLTNQTAAAFAKEVEQQRRIGQAPVEAIRRAARDRELPLSNAQQRLWFIDQLEPGSAAYNIPCAVRLRGRLDVDSLRRSLNEIVRRHEVLRTRFPSRDGHARQEVQEAGELQADFIDLMQSDGAGQEQKLQVVLQDEAKRGFDLARGPLIRAKLIRMAEEEHVFIAIMHHIVSDAWSARVIIREFCQLYEAFSQGQESPLPEPEIQYGDYAVWQREWLQGEVLDRQLQYWRRQLEGLRMLELPTDRARPAVASYRGASERIRLSEELTQKLRQMSQREGVTLFMSLLAGFQVLLARYSGQQDIAVGTSIAGRNRQETEGLVGLFIKALVIRVNVGGNPSVPELLARVREAALGAYAHQDLPIEKLVEEIRMEKSPSHQPMFQAWFASQDIPAERMDLPGLRVESFPGDDSLLKFDLMLSFSEGQKELTGTLRYSTDLFDRKRIKRMLSHYEYILEGMAADEESNSTEPDIEGEQYEHTAIA